MSGAVTGHWQSRGNRGRGWNECEELGWINRKLALRFPCQRWRVRLSFPVHEQPSVPTRETPNGSSQRALAFSGDGSVDDREDGGPAMRGRLAAAVLILAERGYRAAKDVRGIGGTEPGSPDPFGKHRFERAHSQPPSMSRCLALSMAGGFSRSNAACSLAAILARSSSSRSTRSRAWSSAKF